MNTKIQFRCKRSGKVVAFSNEHDIIAMRREPGYEEITQCDSLMRATEPEIVAKMPARRGRPRKA